MLKDIFVCGSSHASGVRYQPGTGIHEGAVKSWVYRLGDLAEANNIFNVSMLAKPIGFSTADTVLFCREYWEKHRTYENLFCIIEYTLPCYKNYEPFSSRFDDTKAVYPITYLSIIRENKDLNNLVSKDLEQGIRYEFMSRNDTPFLEQQPGDGTWSFVNQQELNYADIERTKQDVSEWYNLEHFYDAHWETHKKFLVYARMEILSLYRWLQFHNIPFLMLWAGGQSDWYCKFTDKFLGDISATKRLIPMKEFTMVKATDEWSLKPWRRHPDGVGHQKIAEYIHNYIDEHNLWKKPNNNLFTGDYEEWDLLERAKKTYKYVRGYR